MRDRRGFTLIELMIAIAIVGITVMIATTNLQRWVYQTNARGFQREVFSRLQEARIRASSLGGRHRVVLDLTNGTAVLQKQDPPPATTWKEMDIRLPQVKAPIGSGIASVTPYPSGTPVTGNTYAFVFNPSGEAYGQSPADNTNSSIYLIDNSVILLTGANSQDNASITVFGWTGKARLN
jgi:prepilin-type N-terminal cleavage/methylation domain-containing protein